VEFQILDLAGQKWAWHTIRFNSPGLKHRDIQLWRRYKHPAVFEKYPTTVEKMVDVRGKE
jgi:hypothetical protein